jgi:signal transduction histidine kinase/CHASE3 domain sensor protein
MNQPSELRGRSAGLTARIVVGSALLALLVGTAFVLVLLAIRQLREAEDLTARSARVNAAANQLERLAIDLETGERGYVITGDPRFLQPYTRAKEQLPEGAAELLRLVVDPGLRAAAERIAADLTSYRRDWVDRVVARARDDRGAAAAMVATGRGKSRLDALRDLFGDFRTRNADVAARRQTAADDAGRRAVLLAVLGLAVSAFVVLLYALYLRRTVSRPVTTVRAATEEMAAGNLGVRVPPGGVGEVAALGRAFNTMADSLERDQGEIARRTAELEAVLNSTLDGIGMTGADGELIFTNARLARVWDELGMEHEGSIWDRIGRLAQLTPRPDYYVRLFAERAADPQFELTEEFQLPSYGRSFIGFTAPVRSPAGTALGRIFVLRETTAEREADRLKEEFVATVSHELRTPLTSMIGYLELVLQGEVGDLDPQQERFLGIVQRNADRLTTLVGDLLFVAQVNANALRIDRRPVDLADLAASAVDSARAAAAEKEIALTLDAEPVATEADPSRVAQLLDNLISNAIKFTPYGGTVRVGIGRDGDNAILKVSDSGIGIPAHEQERLFQRFFRTESARAREIPGTGLGLAICRAIAEAHGGTIEVDSVEGHGTTFRVLLPVVVATEAA